MATGNISNCTKLPAILDGTFFKVVSLDGDKVVAKCMKCASNKTHAGLLTATSNFLTHLKVRITEFNSIVQGTVQYSSARSDEMTLRPKP